MVHIPGLPAYYHIKKTHHSTVGHLNIKELKVRPKSFLVAASLRSVEGGMSIIKLGWGVGGGVRMVKVGLGGGWFKGQSHDVRMRKTLP